MYTKLRQAICFRPHQGIILFNVVLLLLQAKKVYLVSVPIRGLFYLTANLEQMQQQNAMLIVSVPIRGLFYLTLLVHHY